MNCCACRVYDLLVSRSIRTDGSRRMVSNAVPVHFIQKWRPYTIQKNMFSTHSTPTILYDYTSDSTIYVFSFYRVVSCESSRRRTYIYDMATNIKFYISISYIAYIVWCRWKQNIFMCLCVFSVCMTFGKIRHTRAKSKNFSVIWFISLMFFVHKRYYILTNMLVQKYLYFP